MDIRNEVLYRVYFLLFGIVIPMAVLLLYKTVDISIIKGPDLRAEGTEAYVKLKEIEADRGNILADDGSVLATSIPYFDIYFDPVAPAEKDFVDNLDSLSFCLANYVDQSFTVGGFRDRLMQLRKDSSNRHVLIKRKVSYAEKKRMEQFPLFNLGQFRGGMIAEKRSDRRRPFGLLAQRTIGYVREGAKPVGLEGYFNDFLAGNPGEQIMVKVDPKRDLWMPMEDLTSIDPRSGDDVITTLDVNLQDIVENALLRAMNYHNAEWGTAVLMEVKTGQIKAISNLGRYKDTWWETYNHAVGSAVEPGSTFKLASIMALLEDEYVNLEDTVLLNFGKTEFYEETLVDASPESFTIDTATVRKAFEISSNVGIAKLVNHYYGTRNKGNKNEGAVRFIERIKDFNLALPTGIEIEGEANPYVKEAYSEEDQWSGTTLPWMSIGYELKITPLQLLSFYNAVANNGTLVKPYLVKEIQRNGETIEKFRPTVVNPRIASKKTIRTAQELLFGVVERGTAKKLKSDQYLFAGKTGTAQINYKRFKDRTRIGGYQASFAGYFPAENPVYSCIVVVNDPSQHGIYGGEVAGPVFREIADKCFVADLKLHQPLNKEPRPVLAENQLPGYDVGEVKDMKEVLNYLNLKYTGKPETELALIRPANDTIGLYNRSIAAETIPAVTGMGLKDALYVLENMGLKVEVSGFGKVTRQSIKPGTRASGQTIKLFLR